MSTFKQIGNVVYIDDLQIPIDVFKVLEPNYNPQGGLEVLIYDGNQLTVRTNGKTSNISGQWTDGERYISRKRDFSVLMSLISKEDSEINLEVDSLRDPSFCRENEYPNIFELVVALWEHFIEQKSYDQSGIAEIQKKRIMVKDKYPMKEKSNASDNLSGTTEGVLPKTTRRTRNRNKSSGRTD